MAPTPPVDPANTEPTFDDLYDVLSADELVLPVGGKKYRIPEVDAETGLWCQRIAGLARKHGKGEDISHQLANLDDDEERDLYSRMLGPVLDELTEDGIPWPKVQHIARTTLVWVVAGKAAAAVAWSLGGAPAPAPNRAARRGTATPAAARSTRKPASESGTTRTPRTSAKPAARKPTRGRTS